MDRRRFIKLTAAAGAALCVPRGFMVMSDSAGAVGNADISVVRGPSPKANVRAAVAAVGGMAAFIGKGDTVVVKPNIAWDAAEEYAATTNPAVVAEVVRMCLEAGASKVKVFDRTVYDPRRCYVQSGIRDAAEAAGAEVAFVDDRRFRKVRIDGRELRNWPIYAEVLDADKLIGVPIAKHHGLAKLTMSLKNWMGVMGDSRRKIHQALDTALVDLMHVVKPALTVLDATRILVANGPQGGSLSDVRRLDTVIAGRDQVAIDAYGATLFGMKGADLGYVVEAASRGLGRMDLAQVSVRQFLLSE